MAPNLDNDTTTLRSLSFLFTNASTPRQTQRVRKQATSPSNRQVVQVIPVCVYWFRVCTMDHCNHVHIIVCRCEAQDLEQTVCSEAREAQTIDFLEATRLHAYFMREKRTINTTPTVVLPLQIDT